MSGSTELFLPPSLSYPIKVVSLDAKPPAAIARGTRLLSYSFVHLPLTPGAQPETRFGTWDSAVEGTVDAWRLKPGDVISQRRAREHPAVVVTEPCKHGVQIGGLCGLCGKDMTDYDYTGFSDASRASIQMTHSAFGPTVSLEEAQKIERATAAHLLGARRLSLIVDLDQTIVHATVDPTVGEWIAEGEAWEARRAARAAAKPASDDSDETASDEEDECNPNWEALKDVKKFRLGPESFAPPSLRGPAKGKGKNKHIESDGCMYYIKPRPGWKDFLTNMATKYEMHVYTMGTRAYAEEVCAAIDPDGKIFRGRLLSRDESGSLTQKSLQRLFPCDTSMVVIIDDRADVWEWSPNLIKVIPYDFFVGIGDINSTFLPKLEPLTAALPSTGKSPPAPAAPASVLVQATPPSPEEVERAELTTKAMLTSNSLALEAQLEERPLAKKQEELQVASDAEEKVAEAKVAEVAQVPGHKPAPDVREKEDAASTSSHTERATRKALLKNDDTELERVSQLLDEVHKRFFTAYDGRSSPEKGFKRRNTGTRKQEPPRVPYDVTTIIPRIRSQTLEGVHILFSSVIPLDTRPEATEIWRMAHMFGARCSTELTSDITHVVAAKRGTVKVDTARRRGGIKIVWLAWFTDSVALWRRQDETPYLLDDPPAPGPSSSPPSEPTQISSDPEPDADDWDAAAATGDGAALGLGEIDWNDINDEVEAAMNESDDDDEAGDTRSDASGMRSERASEDDWTEEGSVVSEVNTTPRLVRKRLRSVTPSDGGRNGDTSTPAVLRSPLSKRKKLAAERSGYSKLKEAFNAEDLRKSLPPDDDALKSAPVTTTTSIIDEEMGDVDDDDEDDEDGIDEDDFLARELEEEWG